MTWTTRGALRSALLALAVLAPTTSAAPPTAVITAPSHVSPTNASTIDVVVTFSEKVSGFGDTGIPTELTITGGSFVLRSFYTSDGGTVYHLKVTPSSTHVTITVVATAGAGTSVATGEASVQSAPFELVYDAVKPSVRFDPAPSSAPSRVNPVRFTLTWDEPVTGFDAAPGWLTRVAVNGGNVLASSVVNATSYALDVAPTPGAKTGSITITVAAGAATDLAGNVADEIVYTHAYDYEAPSPSITTSLATPTRTSPIPVTIEWKEAVTPDITVADVVMTGPGTVQNFRKASTGRFELDLVPTISQADLQVSVKAGAVADSAGNANDGAALLPVKYDTVPPAADAVGVLGGKTPTNQNPIVVVFNFSETVTQFSAAGVEVMAGGGVVTGTKSVSAQSDVFHAYVAAPANSTLGTIAVRLADQAVIDLAGNRNGVGQVVSVPYDYTRPNLTMRVANGSEAISRTPGKPVVIEISSDETLAADLTAAGVVGRRAVTTAASPLRTVTSRRTFEVGFLPGDPSPGQGQGEAAAIVLVNAVSDLAGNLNTRTEFTFQYDFQPPKPTISMADANATRTARIVVPFVLDFGEAVNLRSAPEAGRLRVAFFKPNATAAEIAATTWTVAALSDAVDAAAAAASGVAVKRTGPGRFGVNVTVPVATVGKLVRVAVHVQPGCVTDLAGHLSEEASFDTAVTHDSKPPVVTFVSEDNWRVTNTNPVSFTFETDEPVTGLSSADVEVFGGDLVSGSFKVVQSSPVPALMASVGGAGASDAAAIAAGMVQGTGTWARRFTFSVVPYAAKGSVTVDVRRRAGRDQAGVDVGAAVRQTLAYDYVRPRVNISEVTATAELIAYLGGYKQPADARKTIAVIEAAFDEPVEKVNSSIATVTRADGFLAGGAGGVVYSPAKVVAGTAVGNFTAGTASRRWVFMVRLDTAAATVKLGNAAGLDIAGNPSMAAGQTVKLPSALTATSGAGRDGRGGGVWAVVRTTALAAACALAVLRR